MMFFVGAYCVRPFCFSENTYSWEQRKLGEVGKITTGSTPPTNNKNNYSENGMLWVTPTDIKNQITTNTEKRLSKIGQAVARVFPANTIYVTCIASIGKNTLLPEAGSCNQQINALIPKNGFSPYFLLTQSEFWAKKMKQIAGSGTMDIVNKTQFSELEFLFPTLAEQTAIGNFFKQLDETIALHQRQTEKYQKLRIGFLESIFCTNLSPNNSKKTNAWEQRKLGDLVQIKTGKLDANAMVEGGKYDFYTSGIKKYKIDVAAFEGPAITIAGNGATVGYMHYADGLFNAYQRTYVLSDLNLNRSFLYQEINKKLQKKIKQEVRAGNIPYIVLEMLTELKINYPSEKEQTAIGNFFKQLDETIALHQRKIEKYQFIKQLYLEKMFIK